MRVNQAGQPIPEEGFYPIGWEWNSPTDDVRDAAIALLCTHLGVCIVRTNATKHGTTEVVLQKELDKRA